MLMEILSIGVTNYAGSNRGILTFLEYSQSLNIQFNHPQNMYVYEFLVITTYQFTLSSGALWTWTEYFRDRE